MIEVEIIISVSSTAMHNFLWAGKLPVKYSVLIYYSHTDKRDTDVKDANDVSIMYYELIIKYKWISLKLPMQWRIFFFPSSSMPNNYFGH